MTSESLTLAKYFFSALAVSEKDLWVNLSPLEPSRVVPQTIGQTPLGQDLLLEDYFLKQLTSSLLNPETESGRIFWEKIQESLQEQGLTGLDSQSWHKIWIVPASAQLTENSQGVFITDAKLKVLLEEDYLAQTQQDFSMASSAISNTQIKDILSSTIIPLIEEEVNHGPAFTTLRQIYAAVLLANWYKHTLAASVLGQKFAGRGHVAGLEGSRDVRSIYDSYLEIFKSGAADLIREEYNPSSQSITPVHYFTGGADFSEAASLANLSASSIPEKFYTHGQLAEITVNPAMLSVKVDEIFELHRNEPLARQVSSLSEFLEKIKSDGQNTPHDISEFEHRLEDLKTEFRKALERQAYNTHVYNFKESYYYNLIYTLVRPNSNLITFRHFVEKFLLKFLKKTSQKQVLIAVSGKAASGKTTLAEILLNLQNYVRGIKAFPWDVLMLSYDDYMIEKEDRDPNHPDPDSPYAKSQNNRFNQDTEKLKNNEDVWTPVYDQTAKGQLKMGLDDAGRPVLFNGDVRMVFARDAQGFEVQIIKNLNDESNRRTKVGETLQNFRLEHDAPMVIKAFGGLPIEIHWENNDILLLFAHSRQKLILPQEGQEHFSYRAEGREDVPLERGEKTEILRYIPKLPEGRKRIILLEGFMTLTAAQHCDFTVNIETSSPIRIWRSILREIGRGRTDENFLRQHLNTLLTRELSEDALIDRLTFEARQQGKKHFDVINYSVAEMFASELLNRGILQGDLNSLAKQIPEMEEILYQLKHIRLKSLMDWLKKKLSYSQLALKAVEPKTLHAEPGMSKNWHTVKVNENILMSFLWDGHGHATRIPRVIEDIHNRSRGPLSGFNILDMSADELSVTIDIDGKPETIRLGRVMLIENLPSIGESLKLLEHPQERSPEWNRVKLKTPEAWIDQFFVVQNILWERGLIDFEPSPYNYGIKNFDDRLVLMLNDFSAILEDERAIDKMDQISKSSKTFYQPIVEGISDKKVQRVVKKFSKFQLRFIANPDTGENYLDMIPEKYRAHYVRTIWTKVPRDIREMNHMFGKTWNNAKSKLGSSAKDDTPAYVNQGIPTFEVYNAVIQHLSNRLENIFLKKLQIAFIQSYQSTKNAPQAGQTPQQQWLIDVYLNQNRNPYDYISSLTNALLLKLMENPEWLKTFDPKTSNQEIRQELWKVLSEQRGSKNLPMVETWKEQLLEKIITFARKLPDNWENVGKLMKTDDAAMLQEDFVKGGVDLNLKTAELELTTSSAFKNKFSEVNIENFSFDYGIKLAPPKIIPASTFPKEYILGP